MRTKIIFLFLLCFYSLNAQEKNVVFFNYKNYTVINSTTHSYISNLLFHNIKDSIFVYNDTIHEKYGWEIKSVNCYGNINRPKKVYIDVTNFKMPLKKHFYISKKYGYNKKVKRMHYGIDLTCNLNDTIYACWDGCVRVTGYNTGGYGYYVIVRHNNGLETLYAHLSKITVKNNQIISSNDCVGLGGSTGRSSNPHLHFEIRFLGLPLNPQKLIDFEEKNTHCEYFLYKKQ